MLWEKRAELRAYARALGRAISETCALLSFKRPKRSHTAPSPNSESLMMTPLGVQAAASAQLCSCARYDMMPPRPVKLGVWPFISFDLGSWHHDKHAFSVQGRISPNVPTRRAWLHLNLGVFVFVVATHQKYACDIDFDPFSCLPLACSSLFQFRVWL